MCTEGEVCSKLGTNGHNIDNGAKAPFTYFPNNKNERQSEFQNWFLLPWQEKKISDKKCFSHFRCNVFQIQIIRLFVEDYLQNKAVVR